MADNKIILIIEDDDELRNIYRQALERETYTVYEAPDGESAIALVDEGIQPDLIILDMMMPRMGGPTVLQLIRQRPHLDDARCVIITAYPHFRESALNYNVDQFLTKPVRPADILEAVSMVLGSG